MKRMTALCLTILGMLCALSGCGQENGAQADLVFVNDADTPIVTVAVEYQGGNGGTQNADSSPLRRGESSAQALQAVEDTIQRDYTRKAVRQALEQLPTEERLAIKAYYYEGLTVKASGGARILERAELHLRRLLADKREGIRP